MHGVAMLAMVAGFRLLHPRQALLAAFWCGYLFLPPGAAPYPVPGPVFEKFSNTAVAVLVGVLFFRRHDLRQHFRPAWPDWLMLAAVALPWASLAANGFEDPVGAVRQCWSRALHWAVPYFAGRVYFADREGLHQLLRSVVWAGVVFVPFCLFEAALGPDYYLGRLLLDSGNQGNIARLGGWRPEVFMVNGGLELCAWMALATVAAAGLLAGGGRVHRWQAGVLLLTTLLCRGVYGYAVMALGLAAVWLGRGRLAAWVLAVLVAVPPAYIGARLGGGLTGEGLVQAVGLFHERGAQSLDWRFKAEGKIVHRVTGANGVWGLTGKNARQPWPDGLWLHPLVKGGWVGLGLWLAIFLLVPQGLVLRRLWGGDAGDPEGERWVWLLALLATLTVVNGLHNRIFLQAVGLMLGAAVSYVGRRRAATGPGAGGKSKRASGRPGPRGCLEQEDRMPKYISLLVAAVLSAVAVVGAEGGIPYYEREGMVVVEAEHFSGQQADGPRRWYIVNAGNDGYDAADIGPGVEPLPARPEPDRDDRHALSAGGGAYIEILPDTRRTHDDPLVVGLNFSNTPGVVAVLSYEIHFSNPGRYYVWARSLYTGGEDNGVHVGLDGEWPASGQRMQWCLGRFSWYWSGSQRTAQEHCGVPRRIYLDVGGAGWHTVQFSMREDGFEMDRWLLTTDRLFPVLNFDLGPDPAPYREPPPTAVRRATWGGVKEGG